MTAVHFTAANITSLIYHSEVVATNVRSLVVCSTNVQVRECADRSSKQVSPPPGDNIFPLRRCAFCMRADWAYYSNTGSVESAAKFNLVRAHLV